MTAIDHVILGVSDVASASHFYAQVLGVRPEVQVRASDAPTAGFRGFTLGLDVAGPSSVDKLIACEVWSDGEVDSAGFAPMFPGPRVERVSPGHLVAVATGPNGADAVVWRWYDAVVLGHEHDGSVRLWEPAHGGVLAQPRASYEKQDPGSRAYASASLPGAEWWVACSTNGPPDTADVELDDVEAMYTENGFWPRVFEPGT